MPSYRFGMVGFRRFLATFLAAFFLLCAAGAVHAGSIHYGPFLRVKVKNMRVFVEACECTGSKIKDGTIEVFDSEGNKLFEGKTDQYGNYSFRPTKIQTLNIVLTTTDGHRADYTLKARNKPETAVAATPEEETSPTPQPDDPDQITRWGRFGETL